MLSYFPCLITHCLYFFTFSHCEPSLPPALPQPRPREQLRDSRRELRVVVVDQRVLGSGPASGRAHHDSVLGGRGAVLRRQGGFGVCCLVWWKVCWG